MYLGFLVFTFLLVAGLTALSQTLPPAARSLGLAAGITTIGCILMDAVQLVVLPWLGLSFAPVIPALVPFAVMRLLILLSGILAMFLMKRRIPWARSIAVAVMTLQGLFLVAAIYGMFFEPFRLTVTSVEVDAPAFLPDRPLRIVQLSDLHVERITKRERQMLEKVAEIEADIIVLTGDYINQDYLQDPRAYEHARQVIAGLHAPYGVYAIAGNTDVDPIMTEVFTGMDHVRVLDNEVVPLPLPGGILYLVGVSMNGDPQIDRQMLSDLRAEYPADAYFLLLYHTSDVIETASSMGIPLYLNGHTHGGQIRLPFYGALATFSSYGKQYEMGRYQVGSTTMFVSRGLGMEGLKLPRVRFLCPPEIVVVELGH